LKDSGILFDTLAAVAIGRICNSPHGYNETNETLLLGMTARIGTAYSARQQLDQSAECSQDRYFE
jgi:hypothetical protein